MKTDDRADISTELKFYPLNESDKRSEKLWENILVAISLIGVVIVIVLAYGE